MRRFHVSGLRLRPLLLALITLAPALGLAPSFGSPILDVAGAPQAVVTATLALAWLNRLTAQAELPRSATLTLFDHTTQCWCATPTQGGRGGQSAAGQPMVQEALARRPACAKCLA
jgi:hypothetical protein